MSVGPKYRAFRSVIRATEALDNERNNTRGWCLTSGLAALGRRTPIFRGVSCRQLQRLLSYPFLRRRARRGPHWCYRSPRAAHRLAYTEWSCRSSDFVQRATTQRGVGDCVEHGQGNGREYPVLESVYPGLVEFSLLLQKHLPQRRRVREVQGSARLCRVRIRCLTIRVLYATQSQLRRYTIARSTAKRSGSRITASAPCSFAQSRVGAAVTVITQLPADVAVQLLSENGWRVSDGPLGGCWTAPDGNVIYGIDEALEVALVGSSRR